jgi:plastocyanin
MQLRIRSSFVLVLGLAACGGGGGGGGGGGEPVLEVVKWTPSGDNQVDTVGQLLPKVIRVKVTLDGALAAGITVNFSGGNLGTTSMVTGDNGIATSTWTLNEVAGPQQVTVTVDGAVGSPLTFNATAVPAAPYQLMYAGPSSAFVADTGQIFAGFAVKVADTFANGIPGRWVQWSSTGPITLSTDSIITDADGVSTMFGTAGGNVGDITVTATAPGLLDSPRNFTGAVVPAATQVNVGSNFFSPDSIRINAGGAVKWVIASGTHSITSTGSPNFQGSDTQAAPATWGPILFSTPGVYQYECSVHPVQMQGKIVVE